MHVLEKMLLYQINNAIGKYLKKIIILMKMYIKYLHFDFLIIWYIKMFKKNLNCGHFLSFSSL